MWQARPARCRTLLTPAGECASAAATESSGKNAGLDWKNLAICLGGVGRNTPAQNHPIWSSFEKTKRKLEPNPDWISEGSATD